MSFTSPRLSLSLLLLLGALQPLGGQTLRGLLVDAAGAPVGGAMVRLLGPGGAEQGRVLTGASGRWELAAPGPGTYRVRAERLGFGATLSEPQALAAGDTVQLRLQASSAPITLAGVVARGGGSRCELQPREGTAVATLWGEVRKVVDAAAYLEERRAFRFDAVGYVRELDPRSLAVRSEQRNPIPAAGAHPFRSVPADELGRLGYVRETPEGTFFYAPDAQVLLSDAFLEHHCFRLHAASAGDSGRIGLDFEPVGSRRLPEIRGTMWLDPATNELRLLEYRYVNTEFGVRAPDLGGRVEFGRAPGGGWIVTRWWIRMPALAVREQPGRVSDATVRPRRESQLLAIHEQGGEVTAVRGRDGRPLVEVPRGALTGRVADARGPLAGASVVLLGTVYSAVADSAGRFALAQVPLGEYTLSYSHPRLAGATPPQERVTVSAEGGPPLELAFIPSASARAGEHAVATARARDSAIALGGLRVQAANGGFYSRARTSGSGRFLTREQIDRLHPLRTIDLFREFPGLEVSNGALVVRGGFERVGAASRQVGGGVVAARDGGGQGVVRGAPTAPTPTMQSGEAPVSREGCVPSVFLDGRPWQGDAASLASLPPGEIEGIEVYSRAALAPARYRNQNVDCGIVLIWLRQEVPAQERPR